jgi:hypothetical protein
VAAAAAIAVRDINLSYACKQTGAPDAKYHLTLSRNAHALSALNARADVEVQK